MAAGAAACLALLVTLSIWLYYSYGVRHLLSRFRPRGAVYSGGRTRERLQISKPLRVTDDEPRWSPSGSDVEMGYGGR